MEPFRLSEIESASAVWTRVSAHLKARLQLLREKNDTTLDPLETSRLRGQIAEIKNLLAAGKPVTPYHGD